MNTKLHRELHQRALVLLNRMKTCSEEFIKNAERMSSAPSEKAKSFHEWNCNYYAGRKLQAQTEYINVIKQLRNEMMPELAEPQNMVQMAEWFHQVNSMTC